MLCAEDGSDCDGFNGRNYGNGCGSGDSGGGESRSAWSAFVHNYNGLMTRVQENYGIENPVMTSFNLSDVEHFVDMKNSEFEICRSDHMERWLSGKIENAICDIYRDSHRAALAGCSCKGNFQAVLARSSVSSWVGSALPDPVLHTGQLYRRTIMHISVRQFCLDRGR